MRSSVATEHALEVEALRQVVADYAATDLGRRSLVALRPAGEPDDLSDRRAGFEAVTSLLPLVPSIEEPLQSILDRLGATSFAPSGRDLLALASLIEVGESARDRVEEAIREGREASSVELEPLVARLDRLPVLVDLVRSIRRRLDERGEVRDDATPELARLRGTVRRRRDSLYRELSALARQHGDLLSEDTVPQRDGRLVLVLQAGARGRLPGLIHGRSATGKSYYLEPLAVVEGNNELQEAAGAIEREKQRILDELREAVVAESDALARHAALVADLDHWQAAHRYAAQVGAHLLELAPARRVRLVGARHPLLDPRLAEVRARALGQAGHRDPVVPLDLELTPEQHALVITGPNAGGKTVALKTLGLAAWAQAAGLPVPADPGSSLPPFGELVATIGDDQDLLADRSTFSGRLLRLREVWDVAGSGSLILLDELGSGTDPEEGTALSAALLEALLDRGSLVVVTTHLGQLAALALERPGAACAAMEFDAERGAPRYRLVPGPPGGSEALALARRVGLAEELVAAAEARLGADGRDYRRLLAEVSALRERLASEEEALESSRREAEELTARLAVERDRLELERREVAKRARRDLETFRRQVRDEVGSVAERLREEWESGRRRGLERKVTDELLRDAPEIANSEAPSIEGPVVVGDPVRHRSLGWRGTLVALQRGRAEVDLDGKRLRCRVEELVPGGPSAQHRQERRVPVTEVPEATPLAFELNLIGERVEPALERLERHLEEAVRQGRREVRVVHGHGTGRLRRAVRQRLSRHALVAEQRAGGTGEGGDGATIARLR